MGWWIWKRIKSRNRQRLQVANKRKKMDDEEATRVLAVEIEATRDSDVEKWSSHGSEHKDKCGSAIRGLEIEAEINSKDTVTDLRNKSTASSNQQSNVVFFCTGISESHNSFIIRPHATTRAEDYDMNNSACEDSVSINSGKPPEKSSSAEIHNQGTGKEVKTPQNPSTFTPETQTVISEKAKEVQAPQKPSAPQLVNSKKAKEVQANNSLWSRMPEVAQGLNKSGFANEPVDNESASSISSGYVSRPSLKDKEVLKCHNSAGWRMMDGSRKEVDLEEKAGEDKLVSSPPLIHTGFYVEKDVSEPLPKTSRLEADNNDSCPPHKLGSTRTDRDEFVLSPEIEQRDEETDETESMVLSPVDENNSPHPPVGFDGAIDIVVSRPEETRQTCQETRPLCGGLALVFLLLPSLITTAKANNGEATTWWWWSHLLVAVFGFSLPILFSKLRGGGNNAVLEQPENNNDNEVSGSGSRSHNRSDEDVNEDNVNLVLSVREPEHRMVRSTISPIPTQICPALLEYVSVSFGYRTARIKLIPFNSEIPSKHEMRMMAKADDSKYVLRNYIHEKKSEESEDIFCLVEDYFCTLHVLLCFLQDRENQELCLTEWQNKIVDFIDQSSVEELLTQLMKDVLKGLVDLKAKSIVHRDLNPHNVMIVARCGQLGAVIANLRVARDIEDITSHYISFSNLQINIWHAPEQRIYGGGRDQFEVDIYSWGLLLYQCKRIGQGNLHPNDLGNDYNNSLKMDPSASQLCHLLDKVWDIPGLRPSPQEALNHPFFWDLRKKNQFLFEIGSQIIKWDQTRQTALDSRETFAGVDDWDTKIDPRLFTQMKKYRSYQNTFCQLVRLIRNTMAHWEELPQNIQAILGNDYEYFHDNFPKLFIEIYIFVSADLQCQQHPKLTHFLT